MKLRNFLFICVMSMAMLLIGCNGEGNDDSSTDGEGEANESESTENNQDSNGDVDYEEMTITFSHNQPVESPEDVGAEKFKEIVENESNGSIEVDLYPASQLGSLREQVESTQLGEIDISMQPAAVVTPFADDVKIVDLPYLLPTEEEEMYRVLDSEVGEEILATLDDGGFHGMGFWPGGYKLLTTANTEITSPEDLNGLTMRVMESDVLISQYQHWGGHAIPVPYAEVYNALQQGIVDGQENPLQTVYLNNYHEVQDYVTESKHGAMTYLLIANSGWYNQLSSETQELLIQAEEEGKNAARESLVETEEEFRQNIIDSGVNYYELSEDEIEEFRSASEDLWEEVYNSGDQPELLDRLINEINN